MDIKGPTTTSIDQGFNFPDHGAIPVFRYGLNKAGACTIIFHGCCVSTSAAVGVFIRTNMLLKKFPSASIFYHILMRSQLRYPETLFKPDSRRLFS